MIILPGFGGKTGAALSSAASRLLCRLCVAVDDTKSSRELLNAFCCFNALAPLLLLRLANTGDGLSIVTTKFDGNTPVLLPNLPRHQPSST